MISKDEVLTLPNDPENYHVERTVSTDKYLLDWPSARLFKKKIIIYCKFFII